MLTHPSQYLSPDTFSPPLTVDMSDNHAIPQDFTAGGAQAPQTQGGYPQGRRVTIGGMNRRSSLGMDDFFNRRPSGFGDLDILGRRDSLDSTTAVLDAAIMDLTRRRLSMAVGGIPGNEMDTISSMGGMNMGNMGHMGSMNMVAAMGNPNLAGSAASTSMLQTQNSVNAISARQKQLQEQQRELERRQKELEMQRQQLISGMEERRRAMQQMQQQMQLPGQSYPFPNSSLKNSALLGLGRHNPALLPQQSNTRQQWIICQFCNSKAFISREEAAQHEAICATASNASRAAAVQHEAMCASASNASRAAAIRRSSLEFGIDTRNLQEGQAARRLSQMSQMNPMNQQQRLHQNILNQEQLAREVDLALDRRFSLTGGTLDNPDAPTTLSNGPFAVITDPVPLAMPMDKDWLTPLHCFVRRHCVQVFTATEADVATPSKGKRKPIQVGQVGIRCPHCHRDENSKSRERGSVYYPTTIASIYNATMNLLQRHLHNCASVPQDIMRSYETLKADDARSGTSKKYWVESALSLGLVDTPSGIRFSALTPPPLPNLSRQQNATGNFSQARRNSNEFFSSNSNVITDLSVRSDGDGAIPVAIHAKEHAAQKVHLPDDDGLGMEQAEIVIPEAEHSLAESAPLVTVADKPYATAFSYHLISQMQPCVFTEADRLGKRKGLPPGFPGLACRHCFGGYGSGRFFPSSIKTLSDTSKTLNVLHNHMMRCRKCPSEIRDTLEALRKSHDEERAKMKFGSQKAFFARVWERLHKSNTAGSAKRKAPSSSQHGASELSFTGGMADQVDSKRSKMSMS